MTALTGNSKQQVPEKLSIHLVLGDLLAHLLEVALGEDEADVADEEVHERVEGLVPRLLGVDLDASPDERVLPHENDGVAPEAPADVQELLGADIVGEGDEHLGVLIQQGAQLLVVRDLLRLGPLDRHRCRGKLTLASGGRTCGVEIDTRRRRTKPSEGQGGRLSAAAASL